MRVQSVKALVCIELDSMDYGNVVYVKEQEGNRMSKEDIILYFILGIVIGFVLLVK